MTDAYKIMIYPQHFGRDPIDIRIRIYPKIRIRISDHFCFKFWRWQRFVLSDCSSFPCDVFHCYESECINYVVSEWIVCLCLWFDVSVLVMFVTFVSASVNTVKLCIHCIYSLIEIIWHHTFVGNYSMSRNALQSRLRCTFLVHIGLLCNAFLN